MRNFGRLVGSFVILAVIGFCGAWAWQTKGPASDHTTAPKAAATQTYRVNASPLADIQTTVNERTDLSLSVSLTDLQTGKNYHYGDSSSFTAASIGKLITATAFMNDVEKGNASVTDTVDGQPAERAIQKMLVDSDNAAWAALKDELTLNRQQAYADSIGITSYDASSNTISSDDIALLLAKLASGKLLDGSHTSQLLSYMEQANYRAYIVAAVPQGVSVYHKVGLLEDRLHDAAIIKKGDRSFVLVVFSKSLNGSYDFGDGASLFGAITDDSLQAFL